MIKCGRVDASPWKYTVKKKGKKFKKKKDAVDCQARRERTKKRII